MSDKKMLEKTLADIEKMYGKGAVIDMSNSESLEGIEFVSSGSIGLDLALGGGYACGRIVEIYGPESSGKTTLTLHAAAEAQKQFPDKSIGFIDAEHALDIYYAQALGVDMSSERKFLLSQPDNGEQALEIAEKFIRSEAFSLVIIDSVAALTPKAEIEGDMGDSKMGLQARLMSQALRKITSVTKKTKTTVIFLNQLRDKIGVMFGSPETTTGGNALKFYASQRLDIRRIGQEKEGDEVVANKTRVKVIKNKVAPPFRKAEFVIVFGKGIDRISELIDAAVEFEIIKKSGSWYSYEDSKLGQGKASVVNVLEENPDLTEEVAERVEALINGEED